MQSISPRIPEPLLGHDRYKKVNFAELNATQNLYSRGTTFTSMLAWLLQIRDLNRGTFGFVQLALDTQTGTQVAIKFIERGEKVLFGA